MKSFFSFLIFLSFAWSPLCAQSIPDQEESRELQDPLEQMQEQMQNMFQLFGDFPLLQDTLLLHRFDSFDMDEMGQPENGEDLSQMMSKMMEQLMGEMGNMEQLFEGPEMQKWMKEWQEKMQKELPKPGESKRRIYKL